MNEILDSNTHSLINLVEEYISIRRNRTPIDTEYFRKSIQQFGYSSERTHDILIEMDDDADKELLAGDGSKRAKQKLIISLAAGVLGIVISIAGAVGAFGLVSFGLIIIPFGIIGTSFVVAGRAYTEIGLVKKRRKRRFLKYQNWR